MVEEWRATQIERERESSAAYWMARIQSALELSADPGDFEDRAQRILSEYQGQQQRPSAH